MEKFIIAVHELYPQHEQAFYKAVSFLNTYACCCAQDTRFPIETEEHTLFKTTMSGLTRDVGVLWNRYLYEICDTTAARLSKFEAFGTESEFYQILSQQFRGHVTGVMKELMVVIFDEMTEVMKEKRKSLPTE